MSLQKLQLVVLTEYPIFFIGRGLHWFPLIVFEGHENCNDLVIVIYQEKNLDSVYVVYLPRDISLSIKSWTVLTPSSNSSLMSIEKNIASKNQNMNIPPRTQYLNTLIWLIVKLIGKLKICNLHLCKLPFEHWHNWIWILLFLPFHPSSYTLELHNPLVHQPWIDKEHKYRVM